MKRLLLLLAIASGCIRPPDIFTDASHRDPLPAVELFVLHGMAESLGSVNIDRWHAGIAPHWGETLLLTGSVPNRIIFDEELGFIVNSLGNSITVFCRFTLAVLDIVSLGSGHNPWDIAVIVRGTTRYLVVSAFLSDSIAVLSRQEGSADVTLHRWLDFSLDSGVEDYRPRPQGLAVSGEYLYAACSGWNFQKNAYDPGFVAVFAIASDDPADWAQSTYISTALNPQSFLAVDDAVHVLCTGIHTDDDGAVYVLEGLDVAAQIPIGGSPYQGIHTGTAVLLAGVGMITGYDPGTYEIIYPGAAPFFSADSSSYLPAIAYADGYVYAADFSANVVYWLDGSGALLATRPTGHGPVDLAVAGW